uniref:Uncharacterized protein n=1 Tax=Ditylenchus dipsaci TaxID=166011 RepID=A0A915E0F4_9BILA
MQWMTKRTSKSTCLKRFISLEDLGQSLVQLVALNLVEGEMSDYLAVDNQLVVGAFSSVEIASGVLTTEVNEPEKESDNDMIEVDEEPLLPPVTNREAKEALHVFQRYSSNPTVLQLCDKVDELMAEERMKRLTQRAS